MNVTNHIALSISLGVALLLMDTRYAVAQQRALDEGQLGPRQTVADRQHSAYTPEGIRIGSFHLTPSVQLNIADNDNVFFENGNVSEDIVTTIKPRLDLRSDWNNHDLSVQLGLDSGRYADYSSENYDDYWFSAGGALDVTRKINITASVDLRTGHESRGSPNDINGKEPTKTETDTFRAGFGYRPGRFFVSGNFSIQDLSFSNVETSIGTIIDNQNRNREELGYSLTLGYEIQPGYKAFIRGAMDRRDYDHSVDANGFNRDSSGNQAALGVELDIFNTIDGEISIGNMTRDYDDASYNSNSESTWSTDSTVYWQLSALTTLVFDASRSISESSVDNTSGFINTSYAISAAHELRRNIVLKASLNYTENKFNGITRTDSIYGATTSVTYDLNRNVYLGASYEYGERQSDVATAKYDRSVFMVWLGLRR